jgi:UDP-N-acetylglucosamine 1-carboxyvinyltransferase
MNPTATDTRTPAETLSPTDTQAPSMDAFVIRGGRRLTGAIRVNGAKNATLPLMAATLAAPGEHVLENCPSLMDTRTMARVLERLGARVHFEDHVYRIDTSTVSSMEAPYELVRTMRASFYVLGPLLARFGEARVSLPGGCAWGPRPVDLHVKAMERLGAEVAIEHGYIVARAPRGLTGCHFLFDLVSVGATGNLLMAAALARGETVIENAALEPDITQLAEYLFQMGAEIDGIGTNRLTVRGVRALRPGRVRIIPDRIEAATYLAAGAIAGGPLTVTGMDPAHCGAVLRTLQDCGATAGAEGDTVVVDRTRRPRAVDVTAAPFPGFPTDMQAQIMALLAIADGTSVLTDTVYHDRFKHVPELVRLGADIRLEGNVAVVKGVEKLSGCPVMATDIRAGAGIVLAGLVAEGETRVARVYHLDRGYEKLDEKLTAAGADVTRVRV